ncbi:MAG: hypothetical protein AAGI01_07090 [Myxococcota bacterium]
MRRVMHAGLLGAGGGVRRDEERERVMHQGRALWMGRDFEALVAHFEAFSAAQRKKLSKSYAVPSGEAEALATAWCLNPERVLDVVRAQLDSSSALDLMEDLALDHDLPIELRWSDRRSRRKLAKLGLVAPAVSGTPSARECVMPASIAAILAPMLQGVRPSLPLLLGRASEQEVDQLALRFGVDGPGKIPKILGLRDVFMREEHVERLLAMLPEPEWLGGALMVLELGGMCYWQEIFGMELEQKVKAEGEHKVVPLMLRHERTEERDIARHLLELGVLFRIEEPDPGPHALLAIPEELWYGVWTLGRSWLMEWLGATWFDTEDSGLKRQGAGRADDMVARLKWLACEADAGRLTPERTADVAAVSALELEEVEWTIGFAEELGLLVLQEGAWVLDAERLDVLDLPRSGFVRAALYEWCVGIIGETVDRSLGTAIGVDEGWRNDVLGFFAQRGEIAPRWLWSEGVATELTGTGYLRAKDAGTTEGYIAEFALLNGYVWSLKLLWLDVLSLLPEQQWYPVGLVSELLQLLSAMTVFTHLSSVLEANGASLYIPAQRSSFLTDHVHVNAFDAWLEDIVTELMGPLGVAEFSEDRERVWLDTRMLSVESPVGLEEEQRVQILEDLLGEEVAERFSPPRPAANGWRPLVQVSARDEDERRVALTTSVRELLSRVRGRKIARYEGDVLVLGD